MERKIEIAREGLLPLTVEETGGHIFIEIGDLGMSFTPDITMQLHLALEEILNPWRPVSERPNNEREVWVTDGSQVVEGHYINHANMWYHRRSMNPTHWKEITLPTPPKDDIK